MSDEYPLRRHSDEMTALTIRIEALERHNIVSDAEHVSFRSNDGATAAAVERLAASINDPRTGLIVELGNFRNEVSNDRRAFKAWIAGAVAVLSILLTIGNIYAPALRVIFGIQP